MVFLQFQSIDRIFLMRIDVAIVRPFDVVFCKFAKYSRKSFWADRIRYFSYPFGFWSERKLIRMNSIFGIENILVEKLWTWVDRYLSEYLHMKKRHIYPRHTHYSFIYSNARFFDTVILLSVFIIMYHIEWRLWMSHAISIPINTEYL